MTKRQRGFKKPKQKFFYKADIFLSRTASVLKIPQSKVKGLLFQSNLYAIKFHNSLDANTLKDFTKKKVEWSKDTYLINREELVKLKKSREYGQGIFYLQNLAEMIPVVSLKPKANEKILDMYPEQTTMHISSFTGNSGEIVANVEEARIESFVKVLQKHNVRNAEIISQKGEDLDQDYNEYFDRVLLNAPSSREGVVHFAQKRPLKNWSIQKTKALAKLQKKLIVVAFNCLKKGGVLVYTTTTISANENESVVSHLLETNKNAVLEEIDLVESNAFKSYKPFIKRGLKSWNNETFHPEITKTIRTIPGKTMFGTYVALIRKV